MSSTSNRGELPTDQAKRNADNAIRCLSMVVVSVDIDQERIDACHRFLVAAHYHEALDVARRIDPRGSQHLCPHPLIVAIAEIKNAIRYSEST